MQLEDHSNDLCGSDHVERFSNSRQWPGERHPTRWDVHDANESPAATFLDHFRAALLHSEGAEEDALVDSESIIDNSEGVNPQDVFRYTYPMALLSDVPQTPREDELIRLRSAFSTSFQRHIFLNFVDNLPLSSGSLPPYLHFAYACLAAVMYGPEDRSPYNNVANGPLPSDVPAALFTAGANLWSVMLEVDNREARLLEAVIAASLLSTYGVLSADKKHWKKASGLLCNVVTISRRLHLTDGYSSLHHVGDAPEKDFATKSSLVSYMLLIDTLHAVHSGLAPNCSTSELFVRMPASNHQFRVVYNSLLHGYKMPLDVRRREDALLLLTAILNDTIHVHCSFLSLQYPDIVSSEAINGHRQDAINPSLNRHSVNKDKKLRNPWAPLTAESEYCRLRVDLLAGLSRWEDHFQQQVGSDLLVLYCFCRLQLHCPDMWELPHLAGYAMAPTNASSQVISTRRLNVPDKAMDLCWQILDHCDESSKSQECIMAVWLPIAVFLSALVVWQKLRYQSMKDMKYGTLKMLSMFKNELEKLPWPCCTEMTRTIDRLMKE